ncbi:lipase family protein [Nocardia sp. CA-120079]|uniref:lipase family protein n=1 Tax=Nocardia sp. CA-120079 TaxID=3239974 RepID=UPI003D9648B6
MVVREEPEFMRSTPRSVIALLAAALLVTPACGSDNAPAVVRGEVVSTTPVTQLSAEQTTTYLASANIGTPARNGVDAYRVVYRTVTAEGAATTASGLVVLPRTESRRLRVVTYEHGTLVLKSDAPSVNDTRADRARTIMFAAAGYAAVAPDYLGLGEGPGTHPYTHAPSEVSASVDLLRAARTMAAGQQHDLDADVLVTGFSQGGQAATALGKALQGGDAPGFGLAALAPISGPYDVQHVETPGAIEGRVLPAVAVFYLAYWITAMNRIYHLYDRPADAFQEPIADRIEQLFDGQQNEITIGTALPVRPELLLTPKFLALAQDPTGTAREAVAASDGTCDWTPRVPVHLYAATGDRNVLYANAEHCLQAMRTHRATLTDLGDIDHSASARVALPQILDWFRREIPAT